MRNLLLSVLLALTLSGCSKPQDTIIPTQIDKIDTIKSSIEKLSQEERELFTSYVLRHTVSAAMGGMFGIKADPIPEGVTIGKAISEQKEYVAKEKAKEIAERELKARLEAERKIKQEEFGKLLSVVVLNKKNDHGDYELFVTFDMAFENKSDRDIAGVKGKLKIMDMFGDKVLSMNWGFDHGVTAHQTYVEKGSGLKINKFMDDHMKLWNTDYDKLKFSFEVARVVFKDGTTIDAPE